LVQTGQRDGYGFTSVETRPIWDKGLRGEGQIVVIADSGCDYDSCFFSGKDEGPLMQGYYYQNRIKIVAYVQDTARDKLGDQNGSGHGTHVVRNQSKYTCLPCAALFMAILGFAGFFCFYAQNVIFRCTVSKYLHVFLADP
jgi:hypothetical protein